MPFQRPFNSFWAWLSKKVPPIKHWAKIPGFISCRLAFSFLGLSKKNGHFFSHFIGFKINFCQSINIFDQILTSIYPNFPIISTLKQSLSSFFFNYWLYFMAYFDQYNENIGHLFSSLNFCPIFLPFLVSKKRNEKLFQGCAAHIFERRFRILSLCGHFPQSHS